MEEEYDVDAVDDFDREALRKVVVKVVVIFASSSHTPRECLPCVVLLFIHTSVVLFRVFETTKKKREH